MNLDGFSRRSAGNFDPNAFSQALESRRREPEPLLDLCVSNPTVAGIPYESDAILAALASPRALTYTPEPFGLRSAREAVAGHVSRTGFPVNADDIVLTASTSEAYAFAFKLLCDPGDDVLVPQPSYPLLEHLARLEGVRAVPYRLDYDGAWHVDLASVRRARGPRTRAILCVNPNNPTGSFLERSELSELASLGLPFISDEVFASFAWGESKTHVRSALEAENTLVLVLDGLSKLVGLPQVKLAWMVLGGPEELRHAALQRLELIADTYLSVGTPVQLALPELLARGASTHQAIFERVVENRGLLECRLVKSPVTLLHASGGWYSVLRLPQIMSEEAWVHHLLRAGVVVQPGYFFDFETEPFVVVSLLTAPNELALGIERLLETVNRHA